jgi:hypothetical protein
VEITKIWERTIVNASQFILRKDKIEIDPDSFRILVEDCIEEYNKARPYSKEYDIYTGSNTYVFNSNLDPELNRVPDWLAECVPVRTYLNGIASVGLNYNQNSNQELVVATQYPYVYKKPTLTVPLVGNHKIVAVYKHIIEEKDSAQEGRKEYHLNTITLADTWFFKLLLARFMKGIGRSRRAFTLSEITITTDADALVADGEALEDKTIEDMNNNKKIYLGLG